MILDNFPIATFNQLKKKKKEKRKRVPLLIVD